MKILDELKKLDAYEKKDKALNANPGIIVLFLVQSAIIATGDCAKIISKALNTPIHHHQDIEGESEVIFLTQKNMFDLGKHIMYGTFYGIYVLDYRPKPYDKPINYN
jgi:hypothetical protein